jgi:hypothetical protein
LNFLVEISTKNNERFQAPSDHPNPNSPG